MTRIPCQVVRPLAQHGHRKPDRETTLAIVEAAIAELPADSLRRKALEKMTGRHALNGQDGRP